MTIQMEAVYENGVFRPLQPVPFADDLGADRHPGAEAVRRPNGPMR